MNENSTPLNADAIGTTTEAAHGFGDRARDLADSAQDKLADVGSTVRDRVGTTKDSLADVLDSGADKLRANISSGTSDAQLAGTAGGGSVAVVHDSSVAHVGAKVADGMHATADWLRKADLEGLKASVEDQVKNHPGRTLLVAVGLGYLIGKALKS